MHLLCTDGLTKHVPDEQIAERLGSMTSAKQVCEQLLQDALDGGGTDNITIIVGRATARSSDTSHVATCIAAMAGCERRALEICERPRLYPSIQSYD